VQAAIALARAARSQQYAAGGAAAISVLTEPTFFDGALEHLRAVRAAVPTPLLRKDFIVTGYQLLEACAAGADAVLLIVGALSDLELTELLAEARRLGLAALVEVHDAAELGRALEAGADIVGVNNRNLRDLSVDPRTSDDLAGAIPPGVLAVAESGLKSAAEVRALRARGYGAFLVGEWLMTSADPAATLRGLVEGAAGE
jgi:indole-3-glycerol phosphate synthase